MKRTIATSRSRRAFTLVELLLAVFLLAIGLLGLLSIFPIGADWTRQITEESIAQNVARNAFGVIQGHYGNSGKKAGKIQANINSSALSPLPEFTDITVNERAYQYGSAYPFPAKNPSGATYFWTALIRLCPDQTSGGPNSRYDLYILVMKKGQPDDRYTTTANLSSTMTPFPGCRKEDGSEDFIPAVILDVNYKATINGTGEYINLTTRNSPQIGDFGIGSESGTAFKVYTTPSGMFLTCPIKTKPVPDNFEKVLWVPPSDPLGRPSDDPTPSPLVYIYQATVTF